MRPRFLTIDDMHALAAVRGGKCLADVYTADGEPLPWECAEGHRFVAPYRRVRRRGWCPVCRLAALGIEPDAATPAPRRTAVHLTAEIEAILRRHGGRWVAGEIRTRDSRLTFECSEGHVWHAPVGYVIDGSWCPTCGRQAACNWMRRRCGVLPLRSAADVARFATERELTYLEVSGLPAGRRYFFRCTGGHMWEGAGGPATITSWCPGCGERGEPLGLGRFGR